MKKTTRILTALAASSALLLGVGSAGAFGGHPGGHPGGHGMDGFGGGHRFERMAEELNLSAEQKTQVEQIMQASRPQMKELRQQLMEKRRALMALARQGYDEAQVTQQAQQVGDLVEQLTVLATRTGAQAYAVLTPEQQAQLEARMQERRERHAQRRADKQ